MPQARLRKHGTGAIRDDADLSLNETVRLRPPRRRRGVRHVLISGSRDQLRSIIRREGLPPGAAAEFTDGHDARRLRLLLRSKQILDGRAEVLQKKTVTLLPDAKSKVSVLAADIQVIGKQRVAPFHRVTGQHRNSSSSRPLTHLALIANITVRVLGQVREQVVDVITLAHFGIRILIMGLTFPNRQAPYIRRVRRLRFLRIAFLSNAGRRFDHWNIVPHFALERLPP